MDNTNQPIPAVQPQNQQAQQNQQQAKQDPQPDQQQQVNHEQALAPMEIQQPIASDNNNVNNNSEVQQNQPINEQPAQVQQAEDDEEGEVNEELQEEDQQAGLDQQQNNKKLSQSIIDKDSYINKLETYLSKTKQELAKKTKQHEDLQQDNKKTKQTLKKARFDFLSSKQQISTLTEQKSSLQKQLESTQKLNLQLNETINVYKEAGDVNFFKNKITELEKLLQVQKQQLKLKETMIDEKEEINQQSLYQEKNKVDVLRLIEKYEKENSELAKKHAEIMIVNTKLQNEIKGLQVSNQELKITNADTQNSLIVLQENIVELEQKLKTTEDHYLKKLKQTQESLSQLMQNQSKSSNNNSESYQNNNQANQKVLTKNPQQKYGIKILTPTEERDLILKEFIQLDIRYQSATEELNSLRQRHYNIMMEIKNISSTHIHKKEYSQLYKKYTKLRKCLESSLLTEESLRKELQRYTTLNVDLTSQQQTSQNASQALNNTNRESRYRSLMLEEPQNAINQVQKIIQKSSESQKHLFTLKQQLQTRQRLIKADKQVKEKDQKILLLEKQMQKSRNLIQLYDTQLTYKNNEIELLRATNQQSIKKIYQLEHNRMEKSQQHFLESKIEENRLTIEILEVKNMQALKENTMLKSQKQGLTELYNDLKSMYEEILNREPQLDSNKNTNDSKDNQNQLSNKAMVAQSHPCKQCQQRQEKQKLIKFSDSQIQTQGLADLYFKEIKSLLTILKKFPQKVDDITGKLEAEKATIHEVKKRFDHVTETYGAKYRQLEEEKKANDQWRLKQKDQIRDQFQDIRELLMNERLVTALRKAKSLIEYYEENAPQAPQVPQAEVQPAQVQGEEIDEEGEYEQGNEKNEGEPIEEQKGESA